MKMKINRLIACLTLMLAVAVMPLATSAAAVNTSVTQATALAQRLSPRLASVVKFEKIKPGKGGTDVYTLQSRDGKVVIGCNNAIAMAVGLNR